MFHIKPSAAIRKNYNEIAEICRNTGEPVFLTKNGEGDLVVMDIVSYAKRESMLKLREQLVVAEEDRLAGKLGFTVDQVSEMLKNAVREALQDARK